MINLIKIYTHFNNLLFYKAKGNLFIYVNTQVKVPEYP